MKEMQKKDLMEILAHMKELEEKDKKKEVTFKVDEQGK